MSLEIEYRETRDVQLADVLALYRANNWSAAHKPQELHAALMNSHTLVTAWDDEQLVGLGNAISDGSLVVYYPHLLVLPEHRGRGIGREIVQRLGKKYAGFHQQMLVADRGAVEFYVKCGFEPAGQTAAMWIYNGTEH